MNIQVCYGCGKQVIADDDGARVCIQCGGRNRRVQTAKELLETITPIDDPEVHAFVEYLEWMKSSDDVDPPDYKEPSNDTIIDPKPA